MNYTKRTKAALMVAVMAMISSTCYAGVDMSDVDAQQQGNQADFRWEAVQQEAKKMTVETPQAEVAAEKAVPIIITAADVDAGKKQRIHPQKPGAGTAGWQAGINTPGGNITSGNGNAGSNGFDSPGGAGTSAGNPAGSGLAGSDAGVNGSLKPDGSGSGAEAAWGSGTYSAGTSGQQAIDDSDTDLRIYPLRGDGTIGSIGKVSEGNVVALPEPEPVAAAQHAKKQTGNVSAAGKTVPLPPVQPVQPAQLVHGEVQALPPVEAVGKAVELPPIEKVAEAHGQGTEKIVELPPIHSVK
ncbi:hypothetical protein [Selenomonas sp.]|uniref:hypothetical protein n=1 Tax=Selenomonas sp. TaxID=2053611 RepID=UPI0025DFE4DF|nr:hypothetical protein [Selenomonas sp.]MBQ1867012.1 hypothetical protein [Selenomonas sp.]